MILRNGTPRDLPLVFAKVVTVAKTVCFTSTTKFMHYLFTYSQVSLKGASSRLIVLNTVKRASSFKRDLRVIIVSIEF